MAKHRVKLTRDHGPHKADDIIEVSSHTLMTFRDRMEPVGQAAEGAPATTDPTFGSPQAEKLAKDQKVTIEQLRAWRTASSDSGYTKPDVVAFLEERAAAAAKAEEERAAAEARAQAERDAAALDEEERQTVIFAAKAEELGKPVEELTDEEKAAALAEFDDDEGGE